MARVPHALARRLDRLARRAHRFHRFAHHPLCDAYAGELVRFGRRTRVCRGCASLLAGCSAGLVVGLFVPLGGSAAALYAPMLAFSIGSATFALAELVRRHDPPALARRAKLLTRALPGFALLLACAASVRIGGVVGSVLVLVHAASAALAVALYRRRGPNRSPCATCPERASSAPCSGFLAIVRRERAFVRVSRRLLAQLG